MIGLEPMISRLSVECIYQLCYTRICAAVYIYEKLSAKTSPNLIRIVVPIAGLEPARPFGQQILSLWCLPIPPYRHVLKGFKTQREELPLMFFYARAAPTYQAPLALLGLSRRYLYRALPPPSAAPRRLLHVFINSQC